MRELAVFLGLAGLGLALMPRPARALVKDGASLTGLQDVMVPAIEAASYAAHSLAGVPAVITSGLDGEHGQGSLHYEGLAVDVRRLDRHEMPDGGVIFPDPELAQAQAARIRARLPAEFDVVLESTHVHIEYDPKTA